MNAKRRRSGRFLVVDGPDGVGKSTQVQLLVEQLDQRKVHTLSLREPGGTTAGEIIRSLLLEKRQERLTAVAESFLFQAARAQLVEEVIRPALKRGTWVVCDRFTLSTLVYQGAAGKVNAQAIERMSEIATGGLRPDLYVVLWADPRVCVGRRRDREADRMESKGAKFLRDVSAAYKRLASRGRGCKLIDAGAPIEEVRARIWKLVEPLLGKQA
ncbi:MAG: dTMP kinase [Planctomycetota bacterium]|nr:dTMP kinase [Planctomycetota bacterium]